MSKRPLVSVCMPVYNGEKYLDQSIKSALEQTYENIEVIAVNDSSDDGSRAILQAYADTDHRLKIYDNSQRLGLVGNWNRCIKEARGSWIKFVFQDDYLAPEAIERLLDNANTRSPPRKAVFCRRKFIFENNVGNESRKLDSLFSSDLPLSGKLRRDRFLWDYFPRKRSYTSEDVLKIIIRWSGRNKFGEPTSFLIARDLFDEIGYFDEKFHHICDLEYWLRIGVNYEIGFVDETLAFFRVHDGSTTSFNRSQKWFQTRYLERLRLYDSFISSPAYTRLRSAFGVWPNRYFLHYQAAIYLRRARRDAIVSGDDAWIAEYNQCEKGWGNVVRMSNRWLPLLGVPYYFSKFSLLLTLTVRSWRSKLGRTWTA